MMLWMALALGVVQGLTEFLPVSSSGHLRLGAELFGLEDPQTLFDVLVHAGTLAAVLVVYRELFVRMTTATLRVLRRPAELRAGLACEADARVALLTVAATVPTGVLAIALGDTFEALATDVRAVGAALVGNGALLLVLGKLQSLQRARAEAAPDDPDAAGRPLESLTLRDALVIGTVQGMAVFRGISRSGSTITAGLAVGLRQDAAAAFSFVLSVPAILGAVVLSFDREALKGDAFDAAAVGFLAAAVVGTIALKVLLKLLDRGRLHHFAWYCFALGAVAFSVGVRG